MNTLKESAVRFDSENHRYFLGAKELSGITKRIHEKCAPSLDFSFANAVTGANAHDDIEGVNLAYKYSLDANPQTKHGINYFAWLNYDVFKVLDSEYIVTDNDRYASPIDIVFEDKFGDVVICDIKTYRNYTALYAEMAKWQLSIYAYLFELQNGYAPKSAFVLQVTEMGCTEHAVTLYDSEKVRAFLYDDSFDCYTLKTNSNTLERTITLSNWIDSVETQLNALKKDKEALLSKLMQEMQENGLTKVKQGNMTFTIVAPTKTTTFDAKSFLSDHPEYEAKYTKETERKGYLKITKSKGE